MAIGDKRLLIVSSFIDEIPTGGVTMHVHRLIKRLLEPYISNYGLCDYKKEGFFSQLHKIRMYDVMHIHASNPYLKLFYVIAGKALSTRSLVTIHGRYGTFGKLKNLFNKWALKYCDVPILINRESYEEVRQFNNNAIFIPAFIPPIEDEEVLSPDVERVIRSLKARKKPLFITNASSRAFTDDGREIYGIEFLIRFFSSHPDYHFLALDPKGQYANLYKDQLAENITIVTGVHSFCGAMEFADVVVRNTPLDGDSFSVKEALFYHKRVLATDAVSRPQGVFLFKYNDEKSFESAIARAFAFDDIIELKEDNALNHYSRLYSKCGVAIKTS